MLGHDGSILICSTKKLTECKYGLKTKMIGATRVFFFLTLFSFLHSVSSPFFSSFSFLSPLIWTKICICRTSGATSTTTAAYSYHLDVYVRGCTHSRTTHTTIPNADTSMNPITNFQGVNEKKSRKTHQSFKSSRIVRQAGTPNIKLVCIFK